MRASSIERLASSAPGRYVSGPSFAHFCLTEELWGVLLWGRPNEDETHKLVRSLLVELEPQVTAHGSVVDASRLESVDLGAFAVLDRYVREQRERLSRQVTRLALVRPEGMPGAVVAGFFEVLPRPYPVRVVETPNEALAFIREQYPDAAPAELDLGAVLARVYAEAASVPPVIAALRAVLDERLSEIAIGSAACALGVSERTLQRRLSEAGTTFNEELALARVRVAQRLLLDTDAPLTSIALDVGCASLQHFSALFRRLTGDSPSAWRTKQRRS